MRQGGRGRPRGRLRPVLCAPALALVALGACGDAAPRARPHIVLITSDTLRADHLSVNGYPRATSPSLDAFAARSTHFTAAVTPIPETGPSFATLFTGRHPEEHGMRSNFEGVPAGLPVLAELLRAQGYRTAAFVENPVLRESKGFPRGFEHYELVGPANENFLRWAREPWTEPTFVWVHYMDPHGPYTPPAELEALFSEDPWAQSDERAELLDPEASGKPHSPPAVLGAIPAYQRQGDESRVAAYVARYDAEIRSMDAAFGELIGFLEERSLYEGSAILFLSDHGESLGEHDYYFEHGWFAYEATLRVPLMIKHPGQREGSVDPRQVSVLDVAPTLLALAGTGPDESLPGANLLGSGSPAVALVVQSSGRYPQKTYGVRTLRWKYLIRPQDGVEELYDLERDPAETRDLAASRADVLDILRWELEHRLRSARASAAAASAGAADEPELLQRLRALGYAK